MNITNVDLLIKFTKFEDLKLGQAFLVYSEQKQCNEHRIHMKVESLDSNSWNAVNLYSGLNRSISADTLCIPLVINKLEYTLPNWSGV